MKKRALILAGPLILLLWVAVPECNDSGCQSPIQLGIYDYAKNENDDSDLMNTFRRLKRADLIRILIRAEIALDRMHPTGSAPSARGHAEVVPLPFKYDSVPGFRSCKRVTRRLSAWKVGNPEIVRDVIGRRSNLTTEKRNWETVLNGRCHGPPILAVCPLLCRSQPWPGHRTRQECQGR